MTDVPDGVPGSPAVLVNLNLVPKCELVERDHGSMKVHVSESMRAKNPSHDVSDLTGSDEDGELCHETSDLYEHSDKKVLVKMPFFRIIIAVRIFKRCGRESITPDSEASKSA